MVLSQEKSVRKVSGGRYRDYRKKKAFNLGSQPAFTRIADKRVVRTARKHGGLIKQRIISVDVVNLFDPKSKKYQKVKVKTVVDSPANRHFIRRNILTKGTIVETEKGKARITSRPGQEGSLNAVLI